MTHARRRRKWHQRGIANSTVPPKDTSVPPKDTSAHGAGIVEIIKKAIEAIRETTVVKKIEEAATEAKEMRDSSRVLSSIPIGQIFSATLGVGRVLTDIVTLNFDHVLADISKKGVASFAAHFCQSFLSYQHGDSAAKEHETSSWMYNILPDIGVSSWLGKVRESIGRAVHKFPFVVAGATTITGCVLIPLLMSISEKFAADFMSRDEHGDYKSWGAAVLSSILNVAFEKALAAVFDIIAKWCEKGVRDSKEISLEEAKKVSPEEAKLAQAFNDAPDKQKFIEEQISQIKTDFNSMPTERMQSILRQSLASREEIAMPEVPRSI